MQATHDRPRRDGGFTIIELVVVVVILSFAAFVASDFVLSSVVSRAGSAAIAESIGRVPESITLVALMLRLAGVAILLFGAGFWYMVELHEAGRLDRFRLGHFLLLALTYSLFFAVFAVLGSREIEAWIAVSIAAVVSYPLLVLHVSTIVGLRFAITSALPLAVLTTAIVVNGVYGGEVQSFVYLGLSCVVIAHLTLTYPRLARGHEARREALEQELVRAADELAPQAVAARTAIADARALLALQDPIEHGTLREWVEHRLAAVRAVLDLHERMASLHDSMRCAPARTERRATRLAGMQLAARLGSQLPQTHSALQEATSALAEHRGRQQRRAPQLALVDHCIACGHACGSGARYCPECGTACAEVKRCRRCDTVLRVPVHLLARTDDEPARVTHCFGCGERHAG